jgi:hypothetical protein
LKVVVQSNAGENKASGNSAVDEIFIVTTTEYAVCSHTTVFYAEVSKVKYQNAIPIMVWRHVIDKETRIELVRSIPAG